MTQFGTNIESLLSPDRICNLIKYSQACAHLGGYIGEFGVFAGGSLEILAKYNPGVNILAIDSFQGVPKESEHDLHREGDFCEVDYHAIAGYFKMVYPTVRIFRGFSPGVFEAFDEHTRFSFVHIDVDMYDSVLHALDFFLPRLLTGGMLLFDDYKVRSTPGCEKAISYFFENNPSEDLMYRGELKYWEVSELRIDSRETSKSHHQYLIVK